MVKMDEKTSKKIVGWINYFKNRDEHVKFTLDNHESRINSIEKRFNLHDISLPSSYDRSVKLKSFLKNLLVLSPLFVVYLLYIFLYPARSYARIINPVSIAVFTIFYIGVVLLVLLLQNKKEDQDEGE